MTTLAPARAAGPRRRIRTPAPPAWLVTAGVLVAVLGLLPIAYLVVLAAAGGEQADHPLDLAPAAIMDDVAELPAAAGAGRRLLRRIAAELLHQLGRLDGGGGLVIVPLDPLGPPTLVVPDAGPAAPIWAPNGEAVLVSRLSPAAQTLEIVVARLADVGGATVSAIGPGGVAAWLDDETILLVDPSGRLVHSRVDGSTSDTVGVGASPSCRPAVASDGTAAYCGRDGALRLLAPR
jgi:hypothetical protein